MAAHADELARDGGDQPQLPIISVAKQNRINIWRDEVAAHTFPSLPSPPSSIASGNPPATPLSATASTSSTSTRSGISRGRRFLNKILRRGSKDEAMGRTEMYRSLLPSAEVTTPKTEKIIQLKALSSEHHNDKVLREKQERLERAARLLKEGVARDPDGM
ncbi:hypothetical protein N3K66_002299 [Trichothecium roseum]|uniref:Uncharacterized protein n=1 Tax=Trichothecium roseum TaxID=47278 RepID=A0ACC0VAM5_9HYPO|nr:hypothetical protein N3K66_002299 [Trichothecium roseum]